MSSKHSTVLKIIIFKSSYSFYLDWIMFDKILKDIVLFDIIAYFYVLLILLVTNYLNAQQNKIRLKLILRAK